MMGSRIGPNAMRHFDQTVRAVRALDLDPVEKFELTSLVDEYVFGYALRAATDLDTTAPDVFEDIKRYVEAQLETGEYPHIEALLPTGPAREDIWRRLGETERDSRRFERGLRRLLDGIEAELTERGVL
jgi:Tetracyclin repressor-like, C-terminal domain